VPVSSSILATLDEAFQLHDIDLTALGLAWARTLPVVTLVPAFGLRALPTSARAVIALALALSIVPAVHVARAPGADLPLVLLVLTEALRGLPVAIAAATPIWAATQAGGIMDNLRGGGTDSSLPIVEGKATPLGALYSILASSLFLGGGGPARVAQALADTSPEPMLFLLLVRTLTQGITLSVAIATPLLTASVVLEVASTLIARAAAPTQVSALLAPLRSIALLFLAAVSLERVSWLLAYTTRTP
jgi:type III secretory pathway component EscT